MKEICPHCEQRISLDADALKWLQGQAEFPCPSCSLPVPLRVATPSLDGLDAEQLLLRALQTPATHGRDWEAPEPEELDGSFEGRYRITALLGRGGMGAVYRGLDTRLDREIAVKLLPIEHGDNPEALARFEREAKAMASLDHPHIAKVHDFGRTGEGYVYFVMELVQGLDLSTLRQRGELNLSVALNLISQVCGALQYAHGKGIVHRDIKPSNILVTRDWQAKVADFGLARAVGTESRPRLEPPLTVSGAVIGTLDYMAPEQRDGLRVDHRVDIYALGVMLYEMLTGDPPRGAWELPSRKVEIDVRLDEIVLRALQEKPSARYQTASEIKLDVDSVKSSTGGAPLPPGVDPQPLPSSRRGGAVAVSHRGMATQSSASPIAHEPQQLSAEAILNTTSSLNTTTLILGAVALLTIGGLAFVLANRKTGDTYNSQQTTTTRETYNSYFTQLFASGVTTKEDLKAVPDIRPFKNIYIGISEEEFSWSQAQALAEKTGAVILPVEQSTEFSRQELIEWLGTNFPAQLSAPAWVREHGEARIFDGRELRPGTSQDSPRRAIFQWGPGKPLSVPPAESEPGKARPVDAPGAPGPVVPLPTRSPAAELRNRLPETPAKAVIPKNVRPLREAFLTKVAHADTPESPVQ